MSVYPRVFDIYLSIKSTLRKFHKKTHFLVCMALEKQVNQLDESPIPTMFIIRDMDKNMT